MRQVDYIHFRQAASAFEAWILVRRTNQESLKYIGLTGYSPKAIECKPKTADFDVDAKKLAGLVVDPTRYPQAFKPNRLVKAKCYWNKFIAKHVVSNSIYQIESNPQSQHYGCLKQNNHYIFGDYDLYDIILLSHPKGNLGAVESLNGEFHIRGPRLLPIQTFINQRIGVPMIQHGCEMQTRSHSDQTVDFFGPQGEQFAMHNLADIRHWYSSKFQRLPLLFPSDDCESP
jgi:hypothetical protein